MGVRLSTAAWALIASFALSPGHAETRLAAGGSWVNGDGSVLTITAVAPTGQLSGTFITMAGCGAKQAHPVTGWYYAGPTGGAVTFSVTWAGCNSVTTWSGQYNNANGQFHALWHLAFAAAPVWNGIVSGAHTFVPQPSQKKP